MMAQSPFTALCLLVGGERIVFILNHVEESRVRRVKKAIICAYWLFLIRSISKRWAKSRQSGEEKWPKNKVNSLSYEMTLPLINFLHQGG
jgi:hypothetical protein